MRTRHLLPALLLGFALAGLAPPHLRADDAGKIKKLVEQLGADSYAERQAASDALARVGPAALDALRAAAKSADAEVRKRSAELLARIEKMADSTLVLDPKMVQLTYKDTPLKDAVADFCKKSGYDLVVHDPDKKLKDVKVTLDTGKVSFWSAVAKFSEAAGVHDADPNAPPKGGKMPAGPGGGPAGKPAGGAGIDGEVKALMPARNGAVLFVRDIRFTGGGGAARPPAGVNTTWVPSPPGQIFLLAEKPAKVPADTAAAIRVRPADRKRYAFAPGEKEVALVLEIATEPKVRWQGALTTQVEKALDDQGQTLRSAAEAAVGGGGPVAWFQPSANGVYQFAPLRLKKGEKETKSLKELAGAITGQALTEPEEVMAIDQVLKADGKEAKGKAGGSIKVTAVAKQADGSTRITFEYEAPPGVIPDTVLKQKVVDAKGPDGRPMAGGMGGPRVLGAPGTFAPFGFRLVDDKGEYVLSTILPNYTKGFGVGAGAGKLELNATFKNVKEEPARLVFMARRQVAVTVPFALKDVELK